MQPSDEMRTRHRVVLIGLLLLATAAVSPTAITHASVPNRFFGVMADGPLLGPRVDAGAEARMMAGAGVGTVRLAVYWRDVQPSPFAPPDFTAYDRVVGVAADAGLSVLPVLVRAPAWAAGGDSREGAVPDAAAYAAFVTAAVQRYGPRGSYWAERGAGARKVPIRQWQVWNEPDIEKYWVGKPWAPTYVTLLRAARTAIKGADAGAQVVAAGLTNKSWVDLGKLYSAGGRKLFDAAAIHPFSRRVENVLKIVELARKEMRRRGDATKPLLLTEVSWSSGKGRSSFNYGWETTEAGQAAKVRDALTAIAAARTKLRIGGVWWYTWLSPELGDDESFSYSGLRRLKGGRPVSKPAYDAFKQTVRRLRSR